MIQVRRLLAVGAFFAVAAILACTHVWGEPRRDKDLKDWRKGDGKTVSPPRDDGELADDADRNRFADLPVVTYQHNADTLFGLQVQPKLPDAPASPCDYLVVIDTSASKAMGPLTVSQQIAQELARRLGPDDRMALWTANLKPRDVSRGFKNAAGLADAFKDLAREVPLGAVNLKKCLTEALASFEVRDDRRRVVVFLGDGKSVADPVDADGRAELCDSMVKKQVAFFAIPMGTRIDSQNLHGLVTGTGGKVVRHGLAEAIHAVVVRLQKDTAEPIFYPTSFRLTAGTNEVLPTRMPPLRRDSGTLVVGKVPAGAKALAYSATGTLAGKELKIEQEIKVPAADTENFFLVSVHDQWKAGKERPALLPSDRALAFSCRQNQLAVEDLLAKGEMCMEQNKIDAAEKLFVQAQQLAPHSAQAKGGLVLVEKMRTGKKSRQEMLDELRLNAAKRELVRLENGGRKIVVLADGDEKKEDDPKKPEDPRDPLEDVKMRRQIAEQQANLVVNEAVRQANRLVRTNPDEAYELLKRTLDGLRSNTDLEPRTITSMSNRLARSMESIARLGNIIKRDQAEALALRAAADARLDLRRAETLAQDRIRERMRVFRNLMDQAREEEAFRQANALRHDLVNQGQPVPPSVTSAYMSALTGYHLRELTELRRVREERFLATLLEVERSHVPFPDEPPVEFPSSAVIKRITRGHFDNWKDWSKHRMKEYSVASLGSDVPGRLFELRDSLNKTVDFGGIDDPKTKLVEALDQLSKVHRITFDVNERAFKYEMLNDILAQEIANPNPIPPMKTTLRTVLKKILQRINVPSGATFLIRRDVIEITTGQFAAAEKAIRVYPVADLVTPIPNAFNQQAVGQTATILGTLGQLGIVGQALGAGGLNLGAQLGGALGVQLGGALGQLGGIQLGGGLQLGGIQLGGVQLGGGLQLGAAAGVGQAGGPAGLQVGGFNFQGNVNLGVGGGNVGITGGQLGQLGNLGGQFGLQGGTQEQVLITLIRQVVGRPRDWAVQYNPITGQPLNPLDEQAGEGGLNQDNNNIGYYPPALALVVKAPSTVHTQANNLIISGAGGGAAGAGMVANPKEGGQILVDGRPAPRVEPIKENDPKNPVKKAPPADPKTIWQEALVKGISDPGLIIATADYLAQNVKFDHAAEFLKANLRQGVVVKPWVYKSLAIALREAGGSAEDIERAEVSAADLEPLDANGYLLAARALAEDKNYDRALAFCRQAAELEPNVPHPYADAARYADMARDTRAMQWATGALLRQDWPVRSKELQQEALDKLESLARRVDAADAAKLRSTVQGQRRRDLVIKLVAQGECDLDLKVTEPTGSLCSALNRQTIGGGTMIADSLAGMEGETYVAAEAFPGEYRVIVEKIWGKPMGNKAQLKIIRNQGTPEETEELITIKLVSHISEPIVFNLDKGRRTEAAFVPPPSAHNPVEDISKPVETSDEVLNKLRALADPEVTAFERGLRGDVGSSGRPTTQMPATVTPRSHEKDRTLYQTKVQSFVANSVDLTAETVLSADRRSVRLSVKPVINTVSDKPVKVVSPIFPGGPSR
ncbi:MAG: hypothetical protein U0840_27750 [Gemmataceae bacterium]